MQEAVCTEQFLLRDTLSLEACQLWFWHVIPQFCIHGYDSKSEDENKPQV